jgi:hypothetical protein
MPLRARKPYILTLLLNEGKRGRRPRTIDGSMDRSIEDPFGVGESSVESADRGRGLDAEEEEEEEEAAGLGGAILEIVCYCCSRESREFSCLRGRREDCKGLNDNLNRASIERLRIRKSIRLKYGCIKRSLSISERENGYKVDIY